MAVAGPQHGDPASLAVLVRNTATQHLRASQHGLCVSTHTTPCGHCPQMCSPAAAVLWLEVCASVSSPVSLPPPTLPSGTTCSSPEPTTVSLWLCSPVSFFGSHILEKSYSISPSLTFHFSVLPSRSIPAAAVEEPHPCLRPSSVSLCIVPAFFIHVDLGGHASGPHALGYFHKASVNTGVRSISY